MSRNTLATAPAELAAAEDGLIIEELQYGPVDYKAVLFKHTDEFAGAMERSVQDCNVLAIEQPGHSYGQRRRNHDTAPQAGAEIQRSIGNLVESRRFAFIDIPQDHPEMPVVEAGQQAIVDYYDTIAGIEPLEINRAKLADAAGATARSYAVRDGIMHDQLAALPDAVGYAKVGVLLGAMHHRAVAGLDPASDPQGLAARVYATLDPFEKIVEDLREDLPLDEDLMDRELLSMYLKRFGLPTRNAHGEEFLASVNPDGIGNALRQLDRIANSDLPYSGKVYEAGDYLKRVHDILQN